MGTEWLDDFHCNMHFESSDSSLVHSENKWTANGIYNQGYTHHILTILVYHYLLLHRSCQILEKQAVIHFRAQIRERDTQTEWMNTFTICTTEKWKAVYLIKQLDSVQSFDLESRRNEQRHSQSEILVWIVQLNQYLINIDSHTNSNKHRS